MNVGELRDALDGVPDDFDIRIELVDPACLDSYHWSLAARWEIFTHDRAFWVTDGKWNP